MLNRRIRLHGLFAVLLALMAQLGVGASVPRVDPITGVVALCHTDDNSDRAPSHAPAHPSDCLLCPLCIALHAPSVILASVNPAPVPRPVAVAVKTELPPPSTAPPAAHRPPSQPRAPPIFS
jgi:hypothetical protein